MAESFLRRLYHSPSRCLLGGVFLMLLAGLLHPAGFIGALVCVLVYDLLSYGPKAPELRLSGRIYDLRAQGHNIKSDLVKKDGKRFARYRL